MHCGTAEDVTKASRSRLGAHCSIVVEDILLGGGTITDAKEDFKKNCKET